MVKLSMTSGQLQRTKMKHRKPKYVATCILPGSNGTLHGNAQRNTATKERKGPPQQKRAFSPHCVFVTPIMIIEFFLLFPPE